MSLPSRILVWAALLAYALSGVLPGGGVVLCIEADGHVTIESVAAGCVECCPGEESEGQDDAGPRVAACPCTDVALTGVEVSLAKTKSSQVELAAPALAWTRLEPPPARPGHASRARRATSASSQLELVRTVVLRV